ncbi:MAG: hypothetical protein A2W23_06310 [Planctomycetes bacterium RBG_16_43_13]|nr:MAG: hypothetical protein A2W23_06310 [Planctomycetes bacterium RBG_16_43_13]
MYLGEYRIDDYVTLIATTHRFSSGAAYAPTAITYRVYEDATDVEIVADTSMTNFDSQTGFYLDRIQCTAAIGYEVGKTYTALIKATVDSIAAITAYTWRILTPPVNVTQWLGTACATPTVNGVPEVDITHIEGTAHASTSIRANLISILGTAITETAGQIAAAFKQFFDIGTPTGNMKAITNVVTATNLTTNNDKTGYSINGTKTTLDALNDVSTAQVNTEVDTALADANLDHLVGTATGIPAIPAGTYIDQMMDDGTAVYDRTTDSLQAIRDKETDIEADTAEIGTAGNGLTAVAIGIGGIASFSFAAGAIDLSATAADFPSGIKKNTALANFMFLMVDSTDHLTPKTGLTITATRSIDGAAFGACANAAAEVASGIYKISLTATDLNGDVITLRFTSAAADDRLITIITTTT